jgi:hypothetical protein
VPSSPIAQERAATPPTAPPPVAAAAAAVAASASEPADNSMLRTLFIGLAGLLAVGTVLRLALG